MMFAITYASIWIGIGFGIYAINFAI